MNDEIRGYYIELGLGYWSSMEGEYPVLRIVYLCP
jgi:hypothetical protein